MEDWQKSMEQFPDEIMYVKPGVWTGERRYLL